MWLRTILLALLLAATGPAARAEEYLKSFRTDITIARNGTLEVTESIVMVSKAKVFRHGIQREIPMGPGALDNLPGVHFEITGVTRDGMPEAYHSSIVAGRQRIYIGKKDVLLPAGEHIYRLTYHIDNQIQSAGKYDVFSWHATGKATFRIERAEARVRLPNSTKVLATVQRADTPEMSSNNATLTVEGGTLVFRSVDPLQPGAALQLKIIIPKNSIDRPH